jgi:protein-disulfide isomerase
MNEPDQMSQADEREKRREERHRAEAEDSAREQRQRLIKLVSAAVFLAIIAVVVAVIVSQSGGGSKGGSSSDLSGISKVNSELKGIPQNGPVLGDPSAKATLVEYGDLQCSTCQFYAENVLPGIISGPVRAGKAKIDFRPVEVIGPQSVPAAAAAEAAGKQGRFWSYIELFYANQGGENSGYVTSDFLTAVAKGAGVPNIAKWNQDRKAAGGEQLVTKNLRQFRAFGFSGTPSFAIQSGNGPEKAIPGQSGTSTVPPAQLEAAINQAG